MATGGAPIVRVAVAAPVRGAFDYLAGDPLPVRGARVRVPFGRGARVGVCLGTVAESAIDPHRLRPLNAVVDTDPVLPEAVLGLLEWAADYYQHPLGEVVLQALPTPLREGRVAAARGEACWRLTEAGRTGQVARAPRQEALRALFLAHPEGLSRPALAAADLPGWVSALRALHARGWVTAVVPTGARPPQGGARAPVLTPDQAAVAGQILDAASGYRAFLLEGVTGSGKTEVYLEVIERLVMRGRQALVLVPEIGLTPQTLDRFRRRLAVPVAVLHSGLSKGERLSAWLAARAGEARVVIGTRSAVFAPMPDLGVVIVDEEHDPSYKQQEGFRYSGRDLAVVRARQAQVPVVLGSATPSLESLHNAGRGRYLLVELRARATPAGLPALALVDLRRRRLRHGLSEPLLAAVADRLGRDEQVLLFLNRRGYAPALICHACGWAPSCDFCDARLTVHQRPSGLRCHHCGAARAVPSACPKCGAQDLLAVGSGTERLEMALRDAFPQAHVARIDRDTVRQRRALEAALASARSGEAQVLVGTQMLAKGHDFPRVTLVGVVDADAGLFSADFRAGEHLAQRILQVAGRAGRGDRPGEVLVQTHFPEHPLLQALLTEGYPGVARRALAERREAGLPPFTSAALLRADAPDRDRAEGFLVQAREVLLRKAPIDTQVLGPAPALLERRAGRYRLQLMVLAPGRARLREALVDWIVEIERIEGARQVRWSLDVDPAEAG